MNWLGRLWLTPHVKTMLVPGWSRRSVSSGRSVSVSWWWAVMIRPAPHTHPVSSRRWSTGETIAPTYGVHTNEYIQLTNKLRNELIVTRIRISRWKVYSGNCGGLTNMISQSGPCPSWNWLFCLWVYQTYEDCQNIKFLEWNILTFMEIANIERTGHLLCIKLYWE